MKAAQQTSEYSKFKLLEGNRPISHVHLMRLKKSIELNNLLHLRPILVDKNYMVIDGQHRLKAAEALSIPIYYQMGGEISDEEMVAINGTNKSWNNIEFFNFYYKKGYKEYLKFNDICEEVGLPVSLMLHYVIQINKGRGSENDIRDSVRAGTLEMKSFDISIEKLLNLKKINNLIHRISQTASRVTKNIRWMRAVILFINREDVDIETFMRKLELNVEKIRPCTTVGDYSALLLAVYNYRNSHPISMI